MRTWLIAIVVLINVSVQAQDRTAARLDAAIRAAGVPIVGVSIGDPADKATWKVHPPELQASAQPTIDAFNGNDPAHVTAEMATAVTQALDAERLTSAVVWAILKQMFPMDSDAQTKTKYAAARTKVISAYKAAPWK